jgi:hypothetical protein
MHPIFQREDFAKQLQHSDIFGFSECILNYFNQKRLHAAMEQLLLLLLFKNHHICDEMLLKGPKTSDLYLDSCMKGQKH